MNGPWTHQNSLLEAKPLNSKQCWKKLRHACPRLARRRALLGGVR
jgi:hypothetical protein